MTNKPTVFVVDDDAAARKSVMAMVSEMGISAEAFSSAEEFLGSSSLGEPGCLITDVRMLGMSGVELQEKLLSLGSPLPVIVITAHAETPLTVRAIKNGAVTLLEKPCREHELWDAIRDALELDQKNHATLAKRQETMQRIGQLTPEEHRVMDLMVEGHANKVIARLLDVSIRNASAARVQQDADKFSCRIGSNGGGSWRGGKSDRPVPWACMTAPVGPSPIIRPTCVGGSGSRRLFSVSRPGQGGIANRFLNNSRR